MPVVPQITNPFQGKGYQSSLSNNQNRPGGEQFEIIQLTKPQDVSATVERETDRQTGRQLPNRADLPQMMVKTPKDPTMAVETLKSLISTDLLATAAANGYTELHGELEGLSKSIYLAVGDLVREMINQESQTTMFSGNPLFDLLRGLAGNAILSGNSDMANSIATFLKAVNFSFNRDEILNALSANLRFLSVYFQPSAVLSQKLGSLADAWANIQARENFELLKGETIKLLHNVSESLLNNEKTQILIPLIIHNLSRYNTNDYMLKDAFSAMLTHVPHSSKGAFISAFDGFLNAVLYEKMGKSQQTSAFAKTDAQPQANPADPLADKSGTQSQTSPSQVNNTTKSAENQAPILQENTFPELYGKKLEQGREFPPYNMTQDSLADGLRGFLLGRHSGMQAIFSILSNLIETTTADANLFNALQMDLTKIDSITMLVDYLNDILKPLPDVPERQLLFEMLSETVSNMAERNELPPDSPRESPQQNQSQNLPQQVQNQPQEAQQQTQSQSQEAQQQPQNQPQEAQQQTQNQPQEAQQQPQNQPQEAQQQTQNQSQESPGQAQSKSQELPEQVYHQPQTQTQARALTPEQLIALVQDGEKADIQDKPQFQIQTEKSSLEELTSFIQKNINHAALKTLDSYNASNLLQSLINAPGVYTPLSHFIIPLQIGDIKAFGELWVDNERGSSGGNSGTGEENVHHLFLTFEIESVGRFETDLYAHGSQVSLAVLHPAGFSGEMKELKAKINRIIASTDYSVKEFQTGVLREPHDLTQIFPRIVEKRTGLDITV